MTPRAARSHWKPLNVHIGAGKESAWLAGLVQADENPLYEDANANGIDDVFERQKRGGLLAATAGAAERQALAQDFVPKPPPPAREFSRPGFVWTRLRQSSVQPSDTG